MNKREQTYGEAFARLQEIHALIESNQPDVDELTGILREASSLLKICKDKLLLVEEETQKIIEDIQ
ncbi:MAG: exodeoxyribonuclease VII small subunit [Candidatus Symbiothrix sp.]|jgi:exodeoxyribonuclease VII small subunit|nr:exodeoxyribonuclease VII small subunit [Candidatus Symbiothrix sp.]